MKSKLSWLQKIKNIEFKTSYVVIIVIVAVIIRFWGESSVTMLQKNVPIVTTTELSREEIAHFIQTKQEYLDANITIDPSILVSRDIEVYLPSDVHEWFLLRGWRPNRFFYVERRIANILNYINERKNQLAEADRLDSLSEQMIWANQYQTDGNVENYNAAKLKKKARDIRYYINRDIRRAGITKIEDDTVMSNLDILKSMLEKE